MKCWSHFRLQLKYFVTPCSHYITHKKNSAAVVVIKQKTQKNHQMLKIFRIFLAEVCILLVTSQKLSFLIINISSFWCSICRTSLRMSHACSHSLTESLLLVLFSVECSFPLYLDWRMPHISTDLVTYSLYHPWC